MAMLEREMRHLAKQAGGAHKTVSDRMAQAKRFCEHLLEQNVQIRYVKHLKARHIEDYVRHRLAQGIDKRTLQNEMSMIRVVLRQAGRAKLADGDRISNRAVGIGGVSRNGTRRAITDNKYQTVQENARLKDPGLAAALELARLMGLRSQEAVQSAQSLKTWQQTLDRGESRLTVVFGTKGGRPRETMILDAGAVKKSAGSCVIGGRKSVWQTDRQAGSEKRDEILAQSGIIYRVNWRIFPAFVALRLGAGGDLPLSGAGIQRERSTGADGDGFGARRRARAICGAGIRVTGRG